MIQKTVFSFIHHRKRVHFPHFGHKKEDISAAKWFQILVEKVDICRHFNSV